MMNQYPYHTQHTHTTNNNHIIQRNHQHIIHNTNHNIITNTSTNNHSRNHISAAMIPQFNLSRLPQIPVIIPSQNNSNTIRNIHTNINTSNISPMLSQSTTNNAFTSATDFNNVNMNRMNNMNNCIPINRNNINMPNLNHFASTVIPINSVNNMNSNNININAIAPPKPPSPKQRQPPKPPSPNQKQKSAVKCAPNSTQTQTQTKSRKRSISDIKNTDNNSNDVNTEGSVAKKRKLSGSHPQKLLRSTATNRVWRQTRQNAKFRMAIELLDGFRSEHGGKLPSLRAIMKMLKVGFPKAHEILDEYAKHIGCSKDKLVQDMTIRQEKKNKGNDMDGNNRKKRINRNIFEYPINVNGKLQEIILNLLHQKKVNNFVAINEMYNKMERSIIEFEGFYNKFGLNDKLRLGQSYFMLANWYFYDKRDCDGSYVFIEKALSTFRDCNYLAINAGFTVTTLDMVHHENSNNSHICVEDIGFFWPQIFEIYILGGHILLDNKQYYDAKTLYLFGYELVKYIIGSTPMNACIALENLSHISKLENNMSECCNYIEQMIKILENDKEKQNKNNMNKNVNIISNESDSERDEDREKRDHVIKDHSIKLLNVKCYYSCMLSLDSFETSQYNNNGNNNNVNHMNKSMEIYSGVMKECMNTYGPKHEITFGVYLYFGLHFINILKFDYAFDHISFIKNNINNNVMAMNAGRILSYDEMKVFEALLNAFIYKLLRSNYNHNNHGELKENCLKIFEYQLLNIDDINHYILNNKQEIIEKESKKQKQQLQRQRRTNNDEVKVIKKEKQNNENNINTNNSNTNNKIKQEKKEENENNNNNKEKQMEMERKYIEYIDKNDIILNYQMNLLLYKFNDFERVSQFINNFENSDITLKESQMEQFNKIKKDFKMMKQSIDLNENNSKHSNHSFVSQQSINTLNQMNNINQNNINSINNMHYDFNVLPNFLPMTAPKSMS